jgi:glycosyltransferase involved in cell wall biosynthesis
MMDRPLRILSIGPQHVCPPIDGGKESIHGALGAIARHTETTYAFPEPLRGYTAEQYRGIGVRPLAIPYQPRDSPWVVLSASMRGRPFKFEKYAAPRAVRWLSAVLAHDTFDAIVCFHAHTVGLAERVMRRLDWRLPVVLREHNIEYQLVESYLNSLPLAARVIGRPFLRFTKTEEVDIWSRVDAVAFISDRDLEIARATGARGRLMLIAEGVPIPVSTAHQESGARNSLLLPFNPKAAQSVSNLKQFLDSYWILGRRREKLTGIRLAISGISPAELATLTGVSEADQLALSIDALGFVPEFGHVIAGSLAVVSPTFVGGGIRKKILEGMAHAVPVIATDLDIATCRFFIEGENIVRLGDIDEFVSGLTKLTSDRAYWQKIAQAGRIAVERHASWDNFGLQLSAVLARLVDAASTRES